MPRNIQVNSLFEITLDRQLPKGLIPLYVLHNIQHKQPQEMLVPLLNSMNSVVKRLKNTILGSITKVDNAEYVQNIYSLQHHSDKVHDRSQPSKPLLPVFPQLLQLPNTCTQQQQVANTTPRCKCSIRNTMQAKYYANQQIYRHHF